MNKEKVFPEGLRVFEPHQNAPSFIKNTLSVNKEEFIGFLNTIDDEVIKIDIKVSQKGKLYLEVNTFKPDPSRANPVKVTEMKDTNAEDVNDLPF